MLVALANPPNKTIEEAGIYEARVVFSPENGSSVIHHNLIENIIVNITTKSKNCWYYILFLHRYHCFCQALIPGDAICDEHKRKFSISPDTIHDNVIDGMEDTSFNG